MLKCYVSWKTLMGSTKTIAAAYVTLVMNLFRRNMAMEVEAFEEEDSYAEEQHHDQCGCVICLCESNDGEKWSRLPGCGHGFHAECIETWLKDHSTCPLCRHNVPSSSSKSDDSLMEAPVVSCFLNFLKHLSSWFVNPLGLDLSSSSTMGF